MNHFASNHFAANHWASQHFAGLAEAVQEVEDIYAGGYFDYEALRLPKRRFKATTQDEKRAKPVLDDIAEEMKNPGIETQSDLEIVLRMRLRLQEIKYQEQYMTWLKQALVEKQALIKRKRRNKTITLLLLH
jgi:hypothetical protein